MEMLTGATAAVASERARSPSRTPPVAARKNNGKCTIKRKSGVGPLREQSRGRKNALSLSLCGVSPPPLSEGRSRLGERRNDLFLSKTTIDATD